ncbi:MAG: hypothetical protein UY92_C0016G0005 [Candidatus Magasanikbacteria bacterium GW2011_GWA2_56_11]|uniref:DUF5673 domain-containing protein n=1 Tax=Candidatus Magasanikbacteria bacterium GW2011_GWA2_56_11 TaxID=1619044 RepID=A0A0G1YEC2_9BACT|nr:MAG: hypothetical protein UY92_C0016G0005 [Candidatus Magasanikbacteria bacterium GW2011_GWA2_56_11]
MPQAITGDVTTGNIIHEWEVAEYERHERGTRWYVIMTLLGGLLVGYAIFTGNFLFALVIVLFAIIIFLQSHQDPHIVEFKITDLGIIISSRFYPYSELADFYLIYNPPAVKMLFIEPESSLRPRIRVPLLNLDPNEIRFTLRQYLSENLEKEEEPFSDKVAREWKLH